MYPWILLPIFVAKVEFDPRIEIPRNIVPLEFVPVNTWTRVLRFAGIGQTDGPRFLVWNREYVTIPYTSRELCYSAVWNAGLTDPFYLHMNSLRLKMCQLGIGGIRNTTLEEYVCMFMFISFLLKISRVSKLLVKQTILEKNHYLVLSRSHMGPAYLSCEWRIVLHAWWFSALWRTQCALLLANSFAWRHLPSSKLRLLLRAPYSTTAASSHPATAPHRTLL